MEIETIKNFSVENFSPGDLISLDTAVNTSRLSTGSINFSKDLMFFYAEVHKPWSLCLFGEQPKPIPGCSRVRYSSWVFTVSSVTHSLRQTNFFCLLYPRALLEPGEAKLEGCLWFVPDMAKTYLPKGRRNRHWRKGKRKNREMEVAVS